MDPDDQAANVASQQSSSMSSGATIMPNYSCLLPAPFDGTTVFEDFITQFKSVASLSVGENHLLGDLRPQFFFCPPQWQRFEFISLPYSNPADS